MKKPRLLVAGSLAMDLIVSTEKFPGSGETVLGKSFYTAPGGKGANQAAQAARLGADVTMAGKLGKDAFGKELAEKAKSAGINTDYILYDDVNATGISNILLEVKENQESQNRIITVSGANMSITQEEILFLKDIIGGYDMVLLQLEIPMHINETIARFAHEAGVPVMLNPAPSAPLPDALLKNLTYISPNEHEIADLTKTCIHKSDSQADLDSVKEAAKCLLDRGVKNVLVTMGGSGAALVNEKGTVLSPNVFVENVVDPTAAGDSFIGAFCTAVCAGLDAQEALAFANYTASITVSRMGAQPSLPVLAEVIEKIGKDGKNTVDISKLFF